MILMLFLFIFTHCDNCNSTSRIAAIISEIIIYYCSLSFFISAFLFVSNNILWNKVYVKILSVNH